jgi:hypothetical protein
MSPTALPTACGIVQDTLICAFGGNAGLLNLTSGQSTSIEWAAQTFSSTASACSQSDVMYVASSPYVSFAVAVCGAQAVAIDLTSGTVVFTTTLNVPLSAPNRAFTLTPAGIIAQWTDLTQQQQQLSQITRFSPRMMQMWLWTCPASSRQPQFVAPGSGVVSPTNAPLPPASIAGVVDPSPLPLQLWRSPAASSTLTTPGCLLPGGVTAALSGSSFSLINATGGQVRAPVTLPIQPSGVVAANGYALVYGPGIIQSFAANGSVAWPNPTSDTYTVSFAASAGSLVAASYQKRSGNFYVGFFNPAAWGEVHPQSAGATVAQQIAVAQQGGQYAAIVVTNAGLYWAYSSSSATNSVPFSESDNGAMLYTTPGVSVTALVVNNGQYMLRTYTFLGARLLNVALPGAVQGCVVSETAATCISAAQLIAAYNHTSNQQLWNVTSADPSDSFEAVTFVTDASSNVLPANSTTGLGRCLLVFVYRPDGNRNRLRCYDMFTGTELWTLPTTLAFTANGPTVFTATLSPDGQSMYVALQSGILRVMLGVGAPTASWLFQSASAQAVFLNVQFADTVNNCPVAVGLGQNLPDLRAFVLNVASVGVAATPTTQYPGFLATAECMLVEMNNVLECRGQRDGSVVSLTALPDQPAADPAQPPSVSSPTLLLPKLIQTGDYVVVRRLNSLVAVPRNGSNGFAGQPSGRLSFDVLAQFCPAASLNPTLIFLAEISERRLLIGLGQCVFAYDVSANSSAAGITLLGQLKSSIGSISTAECFNEQCVVATPNGILFAVDASMSSEAVVWQLPRVATAAAPRIAVSATMVFFASANGIVGAVARGAPSFVVWTSDLTNFGLTGVQRPTMCRGALLIGADTALVRLDPSATGVFNATNPRITWSAVPPGATPSAPAPLRAAPLCTPWSTVVSSHANQISGVDFDTGMLMWNVATQAPCSQLQLRDRYVLAQCGDVLVVDALTGAVAFRLGQGTAVAWADKLQERNGRPIALVSSATAQAVFAWELPLNTTGAAPPTVAPFPTEAPNATLPSAVTAAPAPIVNVSTNASALTATGAPALASFESVVSPFAVATHLGLNWFYQFVTAPGQAAVLVGEPAAPDVPTSRWTARLSTCLLGYDAAAIVDNAEGNFVAIVCSAGVEMFNRYLGTPKSAAAFPPNYVYLGFVDPITTVSAVCVPVNVTNTTTGALQTGAVICVNAVTSNMTLINISNTAGAAPAVTALAAAPYADSVVIAFQGNNGTGIEVRSVSNGSLIGQSFGSPSCMRSELLRGRRQDWFGVLLCTTGAGQPTVQIVNTSVGALLGMIPTNASWGVVADIRVSFSDALQLPILVVSYVGRVVAYSVQGLGGSRLWDHTFAGMQSAPNIQLPQAGNVVLVTHAGVPSFIYLLELATGAAKQGSPNPELLLPLNSGAAPTSAEYIAGDLIIQTNGGLVGVLSPTLEVSWVAASNQSVVDPKASSIGVMTATAVFQYILYRAGWIASTAAASSASLSATSSPIVGWFPEASSQVPAGSILVNTGDAIRLLNATTGMQLWATSLPTQSAGLATFLGNRVLVSSVYGLIALSLHDGTLTQSLDFAPDDFAAGRPLTFAKDGAAGVAVFAGQSGGLYVITNDAGALRQTFHPTSIVATQLAITAEGIVWIGADSHLRLTDRETGTTAWEVSVPTPGGQTAAFVSLGLYVYVVTSIGDVLCIHRETGTLMFRYAVSTDRQLSVQLAAWNDTIVVTDGVRVIGLNADPAATTRQRWTALLNGSSTQGSMSITTAANGWVVLTDTAGGEVYVVNVSAPPLTTLQPHASLGLPLPQAPVITGAYAVYATAESTIVLDLQAGMLLVLPAVGNGGILVGNGAQFVDSGIVFVTADASSVSVVIVPWDHPSSLNPPQPTPPAPQQTPNVTAEPMPTRATLPPGQQWPTVGCLADQAATSSRFQSCVNRRVIIAAFVPAEMDCADLADGLSRCVAAFVEQMGPTCTPGNVYLQQQLALMNSSGPFSGLCAGSGCKQASDAAAMCNALTLPSTALLPAPDSIATNAPTQPSFPAFTLPPSVTTTAVPVTTTTSAPNTTVAPTTTTVAPTPTPTPTTTPTPTPTSTRRRRLFQHLRLLRRQTGRQRLHLREQPRSLHQHHHRRQRRTRRQQRRRPHRPPRPSLPPRRQCRPQPRVRGLRRKVSRSTTRRASHCRMRRSLRNSWRRPLWGWLSRSVCPSSVPTTNLPSVRSR